VIRQAEKMGRLAMIGNPAENGRQLAYQKRLLKQAASTPEGGRHRPDDLDKGTDLDAISGLPCPWPHCHQFTEGDQKNDHNGNVEKCHRVEKVHDHTSFPTLNPFAAPQA